MILHEDKDMMYGIEDLLDRSDRMFMVEFKIIDRRRRVSWQII